MIHVVLLSGGSGTRLWPLSNSSRSKQFLKVLPGPGGTRVSMVQRVLSQVRAAGAGVDITIATAESQADAIRSQAEGEYSLVLEPERRDTAPAIMLACAHLSMERGTDPSDTVVVMPIDTYADQAYYDGVAELDRAVREGSAELVLLGVEPTFPSSKYGYVVPASTDAVPMPVARFTEKPSEADAARLIGEGALWNCGVFAFRLGWLTGIASGYLDTGSFEEFRSRYSELPRNSFDYEVVEGARSVAVVPYSGTWKDLGTWNTLTDEMADAVTGRASVDPATCSNVHVVNETGLPVAVAGISDAVVAATPDGILVASKAASAGIKSLVAEVAESRPMYEERRWGEYRVLDSSAYPDGSRALTKELTVREGRQLSYQRHQHRSEVWTVVSGNGEVVLDGLVRQVRAGSVVDIPKGTLHACRAVGSDMRIVEVQLGDDLVEEDIERFGTWWE